MAKHFPKLQQQQKGICSTFLPTPQQEFRNNTYPDRVILAGSGQCILIVRMPVQTVDFGEMSCQILHCSAGFLQGETLSFSAQDT